MANRRDFFYRQRVVEAELDDAFEEMEFADYDISFDNGLAQAGDATGVPYDDPAAGGYLGALMGGIHSGLKCSFGGLPSADMKITVTAGWATDVQGRRIVVGYRHDPATGRHTLTNASYLVDAAAQGDTPIGEAGSTTGGGTSLPPGGQTRIITLMVYFARQLLDPRVDGNAATVNFERNESFRFRIKAGASSAGTPTPPTPDADCIILGDFTVSSAGVITAQDFKRRGDWVRGNRDGATRPTAETTEGTGDYIQGDPRRAIIKMATMIQASLGALGGHVNQAAPTDKHAAKNIDFTQTLATWADGATRIPTSAGGGAATDGVQAAINWIVANLGSFTGPTYGARLIGNATQPASATQQYGFVNTNAGLQLLDLLNYLNDHVSKGLSVPTPGFAHETELIHGSAYNPGGFTGFSISADTLRGQLQQLTVGVNMRGTLTGTNNWQGANSFTGNPVTFQQPMRMNPLGFNQALIDNTGATLPSLSAHKQLIASWKLSNALNTRARLYIEHANNTDGSPAFFITINAVYQEPAGATPWSADEAGAAAAKFAFTADGLVVMGRTSTGAAWDDTRTATGWNYLTMLGANMNGVHTASTMGATVQPGGTVVTNGTQVLKFCQRFWHASNAPIEFSSRHHLNFRATYTVPPATITFSAATEPDVNVTNNTWSAFSITNYGARISFAATNPNAETNFHREITIAP